MPTETDQLRTAVLSRHFTTAGEDPLDAVEWERRDAWPDDPKYHRPAVEVPRSWSQSALDIASKLYLARGSYEEDSIKQMICRVVDKITIEGARHDYFGEVVEPQQGWDLSLIGQRAWIRRGMLDHPAQVFNAELKHILVNQLATFNSPVWFNIGRDDRPACPSACFLLSVDDNSRSIMKWADDEAFIFKAGSGSGVNVSRIRGSMESLSTGGIASGPVSFMRITDAVAGTFKSGGSTRRAAKLVVLDADHPDVRDFIDAKVREEKRIRILAAAGIDISMSEEGERNVAEATSYQNANVSVSTTDEFMRKATEGGPGDMDRDLFWFLVARKKGVFDQDQTSIESAPILLDEIARAAWACADPGMFFYDNINRWNTTANDGPITHGNPCMEVVVPAPASCNLASINVLKFIDVDGNFDVEGFRHTVDVMITAMDVLVAFCELPTEELTERTKRYRWLGLGYSNLGAALMAQGLAYDSQKARDLAAAITALLTGRAYSRSAALAAQMGAFEGFADDRDSMLDVIDRHLSYLPEDVHDESEGSIWSAAIGDWHDAAAQGQRAGYRNAQVTVVAPAGTTSFFMDCDTTGVEPAFALTTHKTLAGGGSMMLVNSCVARAAKGLGYTKANVLEIVAGDLSRIRDEHLPVFAGANEIAPEGHVKMVAAVQPFLSGSVSKTINCPAETTWEEIRDLYVLAWRLGLKCISVYRDGSKARQVLSSKPKTDWAGKSKVEVLQGTVPAIGGPHPRPSGPVDEIELPKAQTPFAEDHYEGPVGPGRRRMPRDATMRRHKMNVGGHEGYLLMGEYEDGTLGEIFLEDIGKEGSHVRGMTNAWAIAISIGLQSGTSLETLVRKYTNMEFEPKGATENPAVPFAKSIPDYVMRVLAARYLSPDVHEELGILTEDVRRRRAMQLDLSEAVSKTTTFTNEGAWLDQQALQAVVERHYGGVGTPEVTTITSMTSMNGNGTVSEMGPPCHCGAIMQRTGSCWACPSCYATSGCS